MATDPSNAAHKAGVKLRQIVDSLDSQLMQLRRRGDLRAIDAKRKEEELRESARTQSSEVVSQLRDDMRQLARGGGMRRSASVFKAGTEGAAAHAANRTYHATVAQSILNQSNGAQSLVRATRDAIRSGDVDAAREYLIVGRQQMLGAVPDVRELSRMEDAVLSKSEVESKASAAAARRVLEGDGVIGGIDGAYGLTQHVNDLMERAGSGDPDDDTRDWSASSAKLSKWSESTSAAANDAGISAVETTAGNRDAVLEG